MKLEIQLKWGEKYGEITAGFDCGKCGRRIRDVHDGRVDLTAGMPRLRCLRKRCARQDFRYAWQATGGMWMPLTVFLESLLLSLGVRGVTIKPSEYIPVAGSVSKSEWVPINRPGSKRKPKKSPGKSNSPKKPDKLVGHMLIKKPKPGRNKKSGLISHMYIKKLKRK